MPPPSTPAAPAPCTAPAPPPAESPAATPIPLAICGPCDKCDGNHATDACPHFKKAREKHRDAWDSYKKLPLEEKKPGGLTAEKAAPAPEPAPANSRLLRGATVDKQPGDGSCLFHSLAFGVRKLAGADAGLSSAEGVRAACLGFIESHPAEEIAGVPLRDWIDWESNLTPPAYCARMRQPGAWGGAIEMQVFSRLANVSVHVYERKGDAFDLISAFEQSSTCERVVRVLYSGRSHYDALTLTSVGSVS